MTLPAYAEARIRCLKKELASKNLENAAIIIDEEIDVGNFRSEGFGPEATITIRCGEALVCISLQKNKEGTDIQVAGENTNLNCVYKAPKSLIIHI